MAGKASWSRYSIWDSTIEIIDAISYASWLRSKIIAHKLNDSFLSISIYDVANVNFLVRQMLLDILEPEKGIYMSRKRKELSLTREEMWQKTEKRVEKYRKLNSFEQFAMYMGVAQLLELSLKNLLSEKYNYDLDKLEKWTLGRTARELEKSGLRPDFITLLKSVVESRNYIAHELLANEIAYRSFFKDSIPENYYSKDERRLHKAIHQLEQLIVIFNWTQENQAWG